MKISYYNGVKDRKGVTANIKTVLERIRLGFYEGKISYIRANRHDLEAKKNLPAACFSGLFSERNDSKIISYSNIVSLDIDEKDYAKVLIAKTMLLEDPYVYSFFESPNRGLKILIKVQTDATQHRDVAFPQCKNYIEDNYGLDVDRSGKNVSRLCFVSSDEELHLNENSLVFKVDENYMPVEYYEQNKTNYNGYVPSTSLNNIFDKAMEWTNRNIAFVKGDRNNYIFQLAAVLNRAGMSNHDALQMICSRLNPNMPYKEISTTVNGIYRRNANQHATRPIYEKENLPSTLF